MTNSAIAVNRFGLGARPGQLEGLLDPGRWLRGQLKAQAPVPPEVGELEGSVAVLAELERLREQRKAAASGPQTPAKRELRRAYGRAITQFHLQQVQVRYQIAATTEQPFRERLVHFFSNHFAVSADKQPLPALAGLFEQEAIRPHVTGRFEDLLIAAVQHPAMTIYLDNQYSLGPNSAAGQSAARRRPERNRGLNENLAREILELHTLGVDGGYEQSDVTAFAKVITGWSVGRRADLRRDPETTVGSFYFRAGQHEPGAQQVLGERYGQSGVEQGLAVLRALARHPATARHLVTKLARHFVADDPPRALIDRLSAAYLRSGGDLAQTLEALIDSPEPWQTSLPKYKSPHDYLISTYRALDYLPDRAGASLGPLRQFGQRPYRPGSPAGWPDTAADWGSADALFKRIEWAGAVGARVRSKANPRSLAPELLGSTLSDATRRMIARAESTSQGLTLLLASPDFLRR